MVSYLRGFKYCEFISDKLSLIERSNKVSLPLKGMHSEFRVHGEFIFLY